MKNDGYALITGASRGLGMAFARALAQRRCNLVLVARSPEPLRAFADELRRANPVSVVAIQVDLSTAGACQILAEQLSRGGIPIELLVNNAGFGLRGEFRANSLPRQLEMLRLNNQAIVELTYSLLPGMLERGQKGIIRDKTEIRRSQSRKNGQAFVRVRSKLSTRHCECSPTEAASRFPALSIGSASSRSA